MELDLFDYSDAEILKFIREECDLTQKELAELTGINIRMIQGYEQDLKSMKLYALRKIAKVCHVKIKIILDR